MSKKKKLFDIKEEVKKILKHQEKERDYDKKIKKKMAEQKIRRMENTRLTSKPW